MMRLFKILWNKIRGDKDIVVKGNIPRGFIEDKFIPNVIFEKDAFLTNYGFDIQTNTYKVLINYYEGNKKH